MSQALILQANSINERCHLASQYFAIAFAFLLPISAGLSNICFVAAAILSLAAGNFKWRFAQLAKHRVALSMLAFFTVLAIALVYTSAPMDHALKMLSKYNKFLLAIPLFFLFSEARWQRYAIYAFIASMVVTLFLSYLKIFGLLYFNNHTVGTVSVFRGHITTNFFMALSAYFLVQECIQRPASRWWLGSLIVLMSVNIFISQGRTGYFVYFGLLLLLLWQHFRLKGLLTGFICSLLIAACAFTLSPGFQYRMQEAYLDLVYYQYGVKDTSVGLRTLWWQTSFDIIKQHPFLGTGTGSVKNEFDARIKNPNLQTRNPHNEYLNTWVQAGIPGLVILLLMFAFAFQASLKLPAYQRFAALGLLTGTLLGCLVNSFLMDSGEGHFFVFFMAVLFAVPSQNKPTNTLE